MADHYSFITIWKIRAKREDVWALINDSPTWSEWWKAIKKNTILKKAGTSGLGEVVLSHWRTALPYSVKFQFEVTNIQAFKLIEGHATGELEGYGKWTFRQEGDICIIRYDWHVTTNKWWMNAFSFALKPIFRWNHNVVMRWGGEGLAKKLNTELVEIIEN